MRTLMMLAGLALASVSDASSFDNEAGRYRLLALPDAALEATRMDRMLLCDLQPAGRFLRKGETVTISVEGLADADYLGAVIGFRPMWGSELNQQEEALGEGETRVTANQDGPLFFKFTKPDGRSKSRVEVDVSLSGGSPLPLYVDGTMSAADWREELRAHARAPFVQLLGDQAMITLPRAVHAREPVDDPQASFATIDRMLDLQNELAGFDGKNPRDQRTPLRTHFLVDFRVSRQDAESFYMYATDEFIGMLSDNTADLTDPAALRERWGIWHEAGHTQQQNSWTWDALAEINVNLFSLYVQEAFGQPSRLHASEDGEPTTLDRARDYLAEGGHDLLAEVDDEDGEEYFIRLVMFYQLKQVWGWDLYKDLHKYFRAYPLAEDASDQDKADALVLALCHLTGVDLRDFFQTWGLTVSAAADERILALDYAAPDEDFSQIFE